MSLNTIKVAVKSHGKEHLKRKAFSHPWKTDIRCVDVTRWGQTVPGTISGNREGPIADSGQPCTLNSQHWWWSTAQVSPGLGIDRALELISEVWWCCLMQTLVHKNSKLMNRICTKTFSGAL